MPFITTDQYYDIKFYNESKEALKNNGVEFQEFVNIKPPYDWYFSMDETPVMVNYDRATGSELRWMISLVKPLRPNEEFQLTRRDKDTGKKAILKYGENQALKEARESPYAVFFTVKNREEAESISAEIPTKIWYMGKYYNNKFRVCLATHEIIEGFLRPDQILMKKEKAMSEPGKFESELNWRIFRGNDYLLKFTETPYFLKGRYNRIKIQGEYSSRFLI